MKNELTWPVKPRKLPASPAEQTRTVPRPEEEPVLARVVMPIIAATHKPPLLGCAASISQLALAPRKGPPPSITFDQGKAVVTPHPARWMHDAAARACLRTVYEFGPYLGFKRRKAKP